MHRYGTGPRRLIRRTSSSDILAPGNWQIIGGTDVDEVSITRPVSNGPLIFTNLAASTSGQVGMGLIGSSYLNVLVEAEMIVKGWDTAVDNIAGGPCVRYSGTFNVSNSNVYFNALRRFSGTSRRATPRRWVGGISSGFGTETTGLAAGYADESTHVIMQMEVNGSNQAMRAKLLGAGSWDQDTTDNDANVTASGMVGIFTHQMPIGMSIELHAFSVTPL